MFLSRVKKGPFGRKRRKRQIWILPTETRASLLRSPKTQNMKKMVGVTQAKALLRKSQVYASLNIVPAELIMFCITFNPRPRPCPPPPERQVASQLQKKSLARIAISCTPYRIIPQNAPCILSRNHIKKKKTDIEDFCIFFFSGEVLGRILGLGGVLYSVGGAGNRKARSNFTIRCIKATPTLVSSIWN